MTSIAWEYLTEMWCLYSGFFNNIFLAPIIVSKFIQVYIESKLESEVLVLPSDIDFKGINMYKTFWELIYS